MVAEQSESLRMYMEERRRILDRLRKKSPNDVALLEALDKLITSKRHGEGEYSRFKHGFDAITEYFIDTGNKPIRRRELEAAVIREGWRSDLPATRRSFRITRSVGAHLKSGELVYEPSQDSALEVIQMSEDYYATLAQGEDED